MAPYSTPSAGPPVLVLDTVHPRLLEGLRELGYQVIEEYQREASALESWSEAEGLIIRSRFKLSAELLKRATKLRFIGRVGAGLENIDLGTAQKNNIAVFNAPEGNRDAVGEQALGMLLSLQNHLHRSDQEVRQGHWRRAENRGTELRYQTVGLIGFGHMGSAFAEKLMGLGCHILAYDKYKSHYAPPYVEEVPDLGSLQQRADVISLHTPQTDETQGMLDRAFFQGLVRSPIIINTARGSSLVTEHLVEALERGQVRGACLDVLEYEASSFEESPTAEDREGQGLPAALRYLLQSEAVLLSPHIAGWTHQSHRRMAEVLLFKIGKWSAASFSGGK